MNKEIFSQNSASGGESDITILLPSIALTKTGGGYMLVIHGDGAAHHLADCRSLWDAAYNIHRHLHLTPALLVEIHSFQKTCAKLHWDDQAVADHYNSLAREQEAGARQKTGPGQNW